MAPRYPDVVVKLNRTDGCVHTIMQMVSHALLHAGVSLDEVRKYGVECISADYHEIPDVTKRWVKVLR